MKQMRILDAQFMRQVVRRLRKLRIETGVRPRTTVEIFGMNNEPGVWKDVLGEHRLAPSRVGDDHVRHKPVFAHALHDSGYRTAPGGLRVPVVQCASQWMRGIDRAYRWSGSVQHMADAA